MTVFLLYNYFMVINMKRMNNKGFTLIEVLAVVAIIAILGLIAVPNVLDVISSGKNSSYAIFIENTKIAGKQLFEEIEYSGNELFIYNNSGKTENLVQINGNVITVNLQTLVGNGLLTGINQDASNFNENLNKKVILNPKTNEDMGMCEIKITKITENYKVTYEFSAEGDNENCPKTEDFQK